MGGVCDVAVGELRVGVWLLKSVSRKSPGRTTTKFEFQALRNQGAVRFSDLNPDFFSPGCLG